MFGKIAEKAGRELFLEPEINISGDREMIIENCRRIEECSDVFMCLISGRLRIQVWGCGLRAFDYRTQGLVIRGRIERIDFIGRGRAENEDKGQG